MQRYCIFPPNFLFSSSGAFFGQKKKEIQMHIGFVSMGISYLL